MLTARQWQASTERQKHKKIASLAEAEVFLRHLHGRHYTRRYATYSSFRAVLASGHGLFGKRTHGPLCYVTPSINQSINRILLTWLK